MSGNGAATVGPVTVPNGPSGPTLGRGAAEAFATPQAPKERSHARRPSGDNGSRSSGRPSAARRQRIGNLVASCAEYIGHIERSCALEVAASERQARLAQANSDLLSASDVAVPAAGSRSALVEEDELEEEASAEAKQSLGQCQCPPNPPFLDSTSPNNASAPDVSQHDSEEQAEGATPHEANVASHASATEPQAAADGQQPANGVIASDCSAEAAGNVHFDDKAVAAVEAATGLLEALAHDNTVMECNLRDYDTALRAAMREVLRLRTDALQMKTACGQLGQLQELLAREAQAHAQLREEHQKLAEKNRELVSVIQEALAASDDDAESVSLIDDLVSENNALRALLLNAEPAAASAAAVPIAPTPTLGVQRLAVGITPTAVASARANGVLGNRELLHSRTTAATEVDAEVEEDQGEGRQKWKKDSTP